MEENQEALKPEVEANANATQPQEVESQSVAQETEVTQQPEATDSQTVAEPVGVVSIDAEQIEEQPAVVEVEKKSAEELAAMSDAELHDYMKTLMGAASARQVVKAVNAIKDEFAKRNAPADPEQQPVLSEGAKVFDELYKAFKAALDKEKEEQRKEEEENAEKKSKLLEQLTKLLTDGSAKNPSSLHAAVRDIQSKWKEVGHIPAERRDLDRNFKNALDEYFDKLKIERALREVDMKRNLEEKLKLCEQAEALLASDSIKELSQQSEALMELWKGIGHVKDKEESDKVWERFKSARSAISKKIRSLSSDLKEREKVNYAEKVKLCEEAEALLETSMSKAREVDAISAKVEDLRKRWKTFGRAPKELNEAVYQRFCDACDKLFDKRRVFFKEQNTQYSDNARLKEALCEKAEAVKDSTDWKQTADYLIELQNEWKTIGPVASRQSDVLWKRFRAACDAFFNRRNEDRDNAQSERVDNLKKKKALIAELKAYQAPADADAYIKELKEFARKWNAIGFVPMKDREAVNSEYSSLLNKHFDALNVDKSENDLRNFKARIEAMSGDSAGRDRVSRERSRLMAQIKQAEQDVETLENNIGFFAKSKNAESIVADVQKKIDAARKELAKLNQKLAMIDGANA